MPLPAILAYAITFTVYWRYPLIFLGTVAGGPALILACGFLLRLGSLDLIPLFIALGVGELTMDVLWYYLGYFYADALISSHGKYFGLNPDSFEKIKILFARHHTWILFISKVMMGFGIMIAILVTAGATRVSLKRYIVANALGEMVWLAVMLSVGYFFGELYTRITEGFRIAFVVSIACVMTALIYGVSRYAKRKAFH